MARKLTDIAPEVQAAALSSAAYLCLVPPSSNLGTFNSAPSAKSLVDKALEILREYYKHDDISA